MYRINFTVTKKKFYLSLHYNGADSYLFVNGKKIVKFKAKDSEIVASPLCLGSISKDWSADNMKKTGLNGYVYEFNVHYRVFNKPNVDETISNIHGYFMLKYGILKNISIHQKVLFSRNKNFIKSYKCKLSIKLYFNEKSRV